MFPRDPRFSSELLFKRGDSGGLVEGALGLRLTVIPHSPPACEELDQRRVRDASKKLNDIKLVVVLVDIGLIQLISVSKRTFIDRSKHTVASQICPAASITSWVTSIESEGESNPVRSERVYWICQTWHRRARRCLALQQLSG